MPYIKKEDRDEIDLGFRTAETVGELTYVLYSTCLDYMHQYPDAGFTVRSELLAALEATKFELYRKHLAPYEDVKQQENGDVD